MEIIFSLVGYFTYVKRHWQIHMCQPLFFQLIIVQPRKVTGSVRRRIFIPVHQGEVSMVLQNLNFIPLDTYYNI